MSDGRNRNLLQRMWPFSNNRLAAGDRIPRRPVALKLVLVTADPELESSLSDGLSSDGHNVEVCRTIRSLRHGVRRHLPDAVLVDWRLPGDGAETVVRFLRGDSECSGIVVVALVPGENEDRVSELLRGGCDDFLSLPTSAPLVAARLGLLKIDRGGDELGANPDTGYVSRETFAEGLRHAVYRARNSHTQSFAVFAVGLDAFDTVLSALGFKAGDELLEAAAQRVEGELGSDDLLALRCTGEMTILVCNVADVSGAMTHADRVQDLFDRPFEVDGEEVFASICIGIALWTASYTDSADMHRDAVTALRRARQGGRNRIAVFESSMRSEVVAELQLVNGLKRAVKRSEFCPYFQPIVSVKDGRISGFEALVRWRHPERGLLMPGDFIEIAERTDTIIEMDRMLMEAACRQLRAWQMRFREFQQLTVSVNVSTREFLQSDFVPRIDLILRSTGLYGKSLKIEVTESVLMEYSEHAAEMLEQLRKLAIGICIDDFGTGYSSFNYLRRFEIDVLKIDRSFVSRMTADDDSAQIVALVAALAKNLGKVTVAEGVETVSEFERLKDLGVDQVQGFYVARPMSVEAAEELLDSVHDADDHLEKIMKDRLGRL